MFEDVDEDVTTLEDEYENAVLWLQKLTMKYVDIHGEQPTNIYISNKEELQSIIMWVCTEYGYEFNRTDQASYCD